MIRKTYRNLLITSLALAAVFALLVIDLWPKYQFQSRRPYTIGVLYNAVNINAEELEIVKLMIDKQVVEINEQGGLAGRPIWIQYLNDEGDTATVLNVIKETISNEDLVAYVGCWSSTRVNAVAKLVGEKGIPFIGGYSVTDLGHGYPNMFSYETGVKQSAYVIHRLLLKKARKVFFLANSRDIYSLALMQELRILQAAEPGYEFVSETWYPNNYDFVKSEFQQLADSIKTTEADFMLLSVNPDHANGLLQTLSENQQFLPVFSAFIDIPEIDPEIKNYHQFEFYDISVFGIPSVLNLRQQLYQVTHNIDVKPENNNSFMVGLGGLHADAIGMIKEAAERNGQPGGMDMRKKISMGLQQYVNGERIYRGWFSDWYFSEERALVSETLVGWKPAGRHSLLLAPEQFLRVDSGLQQVQVMFTNIDMEEIDQISDEEKSFNASFFLSLSSASPIDIRQIDFPNAVRNDNNNKPLLAVKLLRSDSSRNSTDVYNYLYRVAGKFYFKPDLRRYPFDEQQFTIALQTNSAYEPFLIQPAGNSKRDSGFTSAGWLYQSSFIGFDQELIASSNKFLKASKHIPYYKFNFTYVLKRAKVDFFLKTLTPLLAILTITYLSVYLPIRQFEALAAIQVTALLSSIALYFSAYKPQEQSATISDKIFIFTYIMITTLIGASIFQYYLYSKRTGKRQLAMVVSVYEKVLFPLIVLAFTFLYIR